MGEEMEKIGKSKIMFENNLGNLRERDHVCRGGACNIKMDVKGIGFVEWTELF
jgi:hypothetical protein